MKEKIIFKWDRERIEILLEDVKVKWWNCSLSEQYKNMKKLLEMPLLSHFKHQTKEEREFHLQMTEHKLSIWLNLWNVSFFDDKITSYQWWSTTKSFIHSLSPYPPGAGGVWDGDNQNT